MDMVPGVNELDRAARAYALTPEIRDHIVSVLTASGISDRDPLVWDIVKRAITVADMQAILDEALQKHLDEVAGLLAKEAREASITIPSAPIIEGELATPPVTEGKPSKSEKNDAKVAMLKALFEQIKDDVRLMGNGLKNEVGALSSDVMDRLEAIEARLDAVKAEQADDDDDDGEIQLLDPVAERMENALHQLLETAQASRGVGQDLVGVLNDRADAVDGLRGTVEHIDDAIETFRNEASKLSDTVSEVVRKNLVQASVRDAAQIIGNAVKVHADDYRVREDRKTWLKVGAVALALMAAVGVSATVGGYMLGRHTLSGDGTAFEQRMAKSDGQIVSNILAWNPNLTGIYNSYCGPRGTEYQGRKACNLPIWDGPPTDASAGVSLAKVGYSLEEVGGRHPFMMLFAGLGFGGIIGALGVWVSRKKQP